MAWQGGLCLLGEHPNWAHGGRAHCDSVGDRGRRVRVERRRSGRQRRQTARRRATTPTPTLAQPNQSMRTHHNDGRFWTASKRSGCDCLVCFQCPALAIVRRVRGLSAVRRGGDGLLLAFCEPRLRLFGTLRATHDVRTCGALRRRKHGERERETDRQRQTSLRERERQRQTETLERERERETERERERQTDRETHKDERERERERDGRARDLPQCMRCPRARRVGAATTDGATLVAHSNDAQRESIELERESNTQSSPN